MRSLRYDKIEAMPRGRLGVISYEKRVSNLRCAVSLFQCILSPPIPPFRRQQSRASPTRAITENLPLHNSDDTKNLPYPLRANAQHIQRPEKCPDCPSETRERTSRESIRQTFVCISGANGGAISALEKIDALQRSPQPPSPLLSPLAPR